EHAQGGDAADVAADSGRARPTGQELIPRDRIREFALQFLPAFGDEVKPGLVLAPTGTRCAGTLGRPGAAPCGVRGTARDVELGVPRIARQVLDGVAVKVAGRKIERAVCA